MPIMFLARGNIRVLLSARGCKEWELKKVMSPLGIDTSG
jgi:hypothetical protein